MQVELIACTEYFDGKIEELLTRAGRRCYHSDRRGDDAEYIRKRIEAEHYSILEHASATFEIKGISRVCSHQLVRHRLASYSQESQRYVDISAPEFIIPPSIANNIEALALWRMYEFDATQTYRDLRAIGIAKEDARSVLFGVAATNLIMTMNFREFRHFINVRLSMAAQWEIRALAKEIFRQLYELCPCVFEDLRLRLEFVD